MPRVACVSRYNHVLCNVHFKRDRLRADRLRPRDRTTRQGKPKSPLEHRRLRRRGTFQSTAKTRTHTVRFARARAHTHTQPCRDARGHSRHARRADPSAAARPTAAASRSQAHLASLSPSELSFGDFPETHRRRGSTPAQSPMQRALRRTPTSAAGRCRRGRHWATIPHAWDSPCERVARQRALRPVCFVALGVACG